MTTARENVITDLQHAVKASTRIRPIGGGSKSALSAGAELSTKALSGVLEYDPSEYTFTALAGTPLSDIEQVLAENGQYLPFDPPLADAGATLGGTVAAGLSGPGRYRFGGVRDFLLGVRFIDGRGEIVTGGGKVVKNAAGFDLPKLMVGSLGQFGVLTEVTFKVFPRPETTTTLLCDSTSLEDAVATMQRVAVSPLELSCLDLAPPTRLIMRMGGLAEASAGRVARAQELTGALGEVLQGDAERDFWQDAKRFAWLPDHHNLVKLPLTPGQIGVLEQCLAGPLQTIPRRYSVGGNLVWLGWPEGVAGLTGILETLDRPALAVTGRWDSPFLGASRGEVFAARLRSVLDPDGKFRLS